MPATYLRTLIPTVQKGPVPVALISKGPVSKVVPMCSYNLLSLEGSIRIENPNLPERMLDFLACGSKAEWFLYCREIVQHIL